MQIFLNVPASKFALPPDRSYRCDTAAGQPGIIIDGTGSFTLSDSQPCRLLTLLHQLPRSYEEPNCS
jgi:hypothetical protein